MRTRIVSISVGGAVVTAVATNTGRGSTGLRGTATATSAADGSFTIANLPAGTYRVCANAPGTDLLDSCRWSLPVAVTVAAGQTANTNLILSRGHKLRIRLDDPTGVLNAHSGKTRGAHVLAGVWTSNGLFHPAQPISKGNKGSDLEVLVPFNSPLRVSVSSGFFNLKDDKGANIDQKGTSVPVQFAQPANPGGANAPTQPVTSTSSMTFVVADVRKKP